MNAIQLSFGRFGITSTILVALFLLLFSASCGSSDATKTAPNDAGRDIYMQNCITCHGDSVTGENALSRAPVHGPGGHTWHHPDGQLTAIINGTANFPGMTMPSFGDKLTDAEIVSVLEHIKSGWTPAQQKSQSELSRK